LGGDILRPIVWLALLLVFVAPFARDRQRSPVPTASQARSSLVVTAVGVLTVAALTSLDVLVAKLLFPADEAGLYAGLSVVGKAVLFVGVTFGTVMFPIASERAVLGRDSRGLLARAIACTLALSGLATLAIALMPQLVASLLVGASFQAAVGLLPLMGVAASMLGIVQLLLLYFMARGDGRTVALGVGFLVIEAALIAAFHASLRAMVLDVAAGAAIAALAGVALAFGSRVPDAPPAQAE
jgi:O-antigen/teichoic acid export membrane protein